MMPKTRMKVAQDYMVFNYGHPLPQNNINPQDRKIVEGTGTKLAPKFVLPRNSKEKVRKDPLPSPTMRC